MAYILLKLHVPGGGTVRRTRDRDNRYDMFNSDMNYYDVSSRKPFLLKRVLQLAVSLVLLLAVVGLSQLNYPSTESFLGKVSYYLTDETSDQYPVIVSAFQSGIWSDTFEKGVLETLGNLNGADDNASHPLTIPVSGKIVRAYGWEEQSDGQKLLHPGVDILGLKASAEVLAALSGNVRYIGKNARLGTYVELDHGEGLVTVYGNCEEILVMEGQRVMEGQVIARLQPVEQPYVHFELRVNGKAIDPLTSMSGADDIDQQP
jgi:murein DD-endopeptidase MepM/ murein hydrolase activator NlpD